MNTKCEAKAVLSRDDIPAGWVRMGDYNNRSEVIYRRVKKAAMFGKINSVCLLEGGRMSRSPRRWVDPVEVEKFLSRGEKPARPLFAAPQKSPPAPAPVESAGVAALVEAVRMLSLEIEAAAAVISEALDRSRPEREPATFGES